MLEALDISLPDVPCDGMFGVGMLHPDDKGFSYAEYQKDRRTEWRLTARRYEAEPGDFFNAWYYLKGHPAFWKFYGSDDMPHAERFHERYLEPEQGVANRIEVWVAKVNPATGRTDDDDTLNTQTEIWLETGMYRWPDKHFREYAVPYHDYTLDCGGATYEQAIINMARNVHDTYGNDRQVCDDHRKTPKKLGEGDEPQVS